MLASLVRGLVGALLGGLGRAAVFFYERLWGDAAKWRTYTVWRAKQEGKVASERDRLTASTERIRQEPDKEGKALEDDVNRTFGG